MIVRCSACNHANAFAQPHAYHAGFANQGFLYSDAGTSTLVWSSFDPAYEAIVGQVHPWTLPPTTWARLEAALLPAPDGGPWRASNPPRCLSCGEPIGQPIETGELYYLIYPGSVLTDDSPGVRDFQRAVRVPASAT